MQYFSVIPKSIAIHPNCTKHNNGKSITMDFPYLNKQFLCKYCKEPTRHHQKTKEKYIIL